MYLCVNTSLPSPPPLCSYLHWTLSTNGRAKCRLNFHSQSLHSCARVLSWLSVGGFSFSVLSIPSFSFFFWWQMQEVAFVFVIVDYLIVVGYLAEMTYCILASLQHCMLGIKTGNKRRAVEKKTYSPKVLQNRRLWTKTVFSRAQNTHTHTHTHTFKHAHTYHPDTHKDALYACTQSTPGHALKCVHTHTQPCAHAHKS